MHGQTAYSQYNLQFKDQVSHRKNESPLLFRLPDIV